MGCWNWDGIHAAAEFCMTACKGVYYGHGGWKAHWDQFNFTVRPDCSGFVSAAIVACGLPGRNFGSDEFVPNGRAGIFLQQNGFVVVQYSEPGRQPGDIVRVQGHVYIVAEEGPSMRYDFGGDRHPPNGLHCRDYHDKRGGGVIFRPTAMGAGSGTSNTYAGPGGGKLTIKSTDEGDQNLVVALSEFKNKAIRGTYENYGEDLGYVDPSRVAQPDPNMNPQTLSPLKYAFETDKNAITASDLGLIGGFTFGNPMGVSLAGGSLVMDVDLSTLPGAKHSSLSSLTMARETYAFRYLISVGYTIAAAAAVIGIMYCESGLDPRAYNKSEFAGRGSNGTQGWGCGEGLCQWTHIKSKVKWIAEFGWGAYGINASDYWNSPVHIIDLPFEVQMVACAKFHWRNSQYTSFGRAMGEVFASEAGRANWDWCGGVASWENTMHMKGAPNLKQRAAEAVAALRRQLGLTTGS